MTAAFDIIPGLNAGVSHGGSDDQTRVMHTHDHRLPSALPHR